MLVTEEELRLYDGTTEDWKLRWSEDGTDTDLKYLETVYPGPSGHIRTLEGFFMNEAGIDAWLEKASQLSSPVILFILTNMLCSRVNRHHRGHRSA